jgi:hypothetical protein
MTLCPILRDSSNAYVCSQLFQHDRSTAATHFVQSSEERAERVQLVMSVNVHRHGDANQSRMPTEKDSQGLSGSRVILLNTMVFIS